MLTALDIRDVVLIEALRLEFSPGLGVLTGETGAGKSILLDALGLALGARGDAGLVRSGAGQAVVTAAFSVGASHPARALLDEQGLDSDADGSGELRPTAAAAPSSTTSRCRRRCCVRSAARSSRCTASRTTAGCSMRAATGRCSTRSAG